MIKIAIWQYQAYIHAQDEARGYCRDEQKVLSPEEIRTNFVADLIAQRIKTWGENYDDDYDAKLYISRYNLADKEKIIEVMAKANVNKSLQENFDVVARGSMPGYFFRESYYRCLKRRPEQQRSYCGTDEFRADDNIINLLKKDNSIDLDYLKTLPKDYSLLVEFGRGTTDITIVPLALIKQVDKNTFKIGSYTIYKYCCDNKTIKERIDGGGLSITSNALAMKQGKGKFSQQEPQLSLDQIDGEKIDDIHVSHLYQNLALNQPEQVQRYGLYWSTGGLRKSLPHSNPHISRLSITACGKLNNPDKFPF